MEFQFLDSPTRGALETCFSAKEKLNGSEPLLILDCDLTFISKEFIQFCNTPNGSHGFPVFSSNDPRYSYCRLNDRNVIETAEKEVISSNAIAGAYFL